MKIGEQLPNWNTPTIWVNGETKLTDEIRDKLILIHFWSVSCYFCKKAMPELNQYRELYKDNLVIISVHFPRTERDLDIDLIKQTAETYSMTQSIYVDHDFQLAKAFSNEYVPSYYLFDRERKLRYYQAGGTNLKMLNTRINRVINNQQ